MSGPRILIVKTSSMGDIVHALPMVSDIARARPDAAIDWVVEEGFAEIPRLHAAIERVIPIALRRWRIAPLARRTLEQAVVARAALRAARYDAIIDCQGLLKSALVAWRARGPVWGPDWSSAREPLAALLYRHRVRVEFAQHAVARSRILGAAALGYTIESTPRFSLRIPDIADARMAELAQRGYAVLLTNASRETKLWPVQRWCEVEACLARKGLASVLFWGTDAERRATEKRADGMHNAHVAPRMPLTELAAVLARARVVIGLDTGLTHLAAAAGAPTLGLFCDYDPALVGVIGDASCASLGGVSQMPAVAEVLDATERLLSAPPGRSERR